MQQEEGDNGQCAKEKPGIEALGRQSRNQQRQQQDCGQDEGQIDPPAFRFRIESVDELRKLGLDEGPAGADHMPGILGNAGGAILAGPDRIDQQEFQRGNDGEP
jgi:hypothetical protein